MDSNQLKIFCAVTEQQSFSKAAKLLHMSQPAVSTNIKSLEDLYQGQFLERTSQGVTLNPAGEVLYCYAKKFLDLEAEMQKQLEIIFKHENNQILVGASTTIGNVSLPCSIYLFKEKYPEIDLHLNIANAGEVLRLVQSGEVDIGVVEGIKESTVLKVLPVMSDELVFIVPAQSTVQEGEISLAEFLKHPLILREEGSGTRRILADALAQNGYVINQLNVITEMRNIYAIKSAVEGGLGGSIVPRLAVRREAYTGSIRVLGIEGMSMQVDYNIVYSKTRVLTPKTKRFIKFLTNPEESCLC